VFLASPFPQLLAHPSCFWVVSVYLVLRPMLHNVVEAATEHVDPVEFTERVDAGFAAMDQV
jgi:hypothetical protein